MSDEPWHVVSGVTPATWSRSAGERGGGTAVVVPKGLARIAARRRRRVGPGVCRAGSETRRERGRDA